MTKIVLTFGLISGVIVSILLWLMLAMMKAGLASFDSGEIWGYTTMIIALSMIFFGIRSYRENNGGSIGFFKGLQIGLLISLISACCYGISWEVYYRTSGGNFMQEYTAKYIEKMREEGEPEEKIGAAQRQMDAIAQAYQNVFIRFGMTVMEILPVGIIVTLISAALLRRREILSAQPA